ncbi:MAG: hypothetical protein E7315_05030 [Clostridiales bacterium]|nr:hypothetical protein [Clostridiales bacterium]
MIKNICSPSEINFMNSLTNNYPPFSFKYEGRPFPEGFKKISDYAYENNGLLVEIKWEKYESSSAQEWTLWFENKGNTPTGIISDVRVVDIKDNCKITPVLSYSNGTQAGITDFIYKEEELKDEIKINSWGSRGALPFFNLALDGRGYILGLGWTSNWQVLVKKDGENISLTAGQPETNFRLYPNERVRSPRALLMYWEATENKMRPYNMLRRHLVEHHIPKDNEGEPTPPICCTVWGGMKEYNHLRVLEYVKEHDLKFDVYWIDAGWHGEDHETEQFQNLYTEDWAHNLGDWRLNRCVYDSDNGLKNVSDAAKELGMKVLLWFHTFVCTEGMGWHKEHPEWGVLQYEGQIGIAPKITRQYAINLNIPEAREWLLNKICYVMNENGIDYYREDSTLPGFDADTEDRIGISDMKAVENFYSFWDSMIERVPGMLIDNCGGGGARIDLETISRAYVLHRSDYYCLPDANPIGAQVANHGLGHWIPLIGGGANGEAGNDYSFLSGLYGGRGFGLFCGTTYGVENVYPADDYPVEWHKRMLDFYRLAKPYLSGDFYPLTPSTLEDDKWMSYAFYREDMEGGIIVGLRRENSCEDTLKISLPLGAGTYIFEDLENNCITEVRGNDSASLELHAYGKPSAAFVKFTLKRA